MAGLVSTIADGIERQEGYYPGSLTYRNNNPGAIWDGITAGKPKRIWPEYPIDGGGFLTLPSYQVGRALMENQIAIKIGRGETLRQLLAEWSNTDGAVYSANLSTWSGLPSDVPLSQLGDAAAGGVDGAELAGVEQPSAVPTAVYIGVGVVAASLFVSFVLSD